MTHAIHALTLPAGATLDDLHAAIDEFGAGGFLAAPVVLVVATPLRAPEPERPDELTRIRQYLSASCQPPGRPAIEKAADDLGIKLTRSQVIGIRDRFLDLSWPDSDLTAARQDLSAAGG